MSEFQVFIMFLRLLQQPSILQEIHIYIYIYIFICMYVCMYVCNHSIKKKAKRAVTLTWGKYTKTLKIIFHIV